MLITAKHENITIKVNSCDMTMSTGNIGNVLTRLRRRLRLLVYVRALEEDVPPSKD